MAPSDLTGLEKPYIVLADDIILRDERHFLDSNMLVYRNSRAYLSEYLSPAAFDLMTYLTRAATLEEAWEYYTGRCSVHGEQPDRDEFAAFVADLLESETLLQTEERCEHRRPLSNLGLPVPAGKIQPMTFPTQVNLTTTLLCNLACRHCLRSASPAVDTAKELTTAEFKALLSDLDRWGAMVVALSGGETTTRSDMAEIVRYAAHLRPHIEFFTNGWSVSDELEAALADMYRHKKSGMQIHFSFDGGTAESHDWLRRPGSFERSWRVLERMARYGMLTVVECILTKRNLHEMELLVEQCLARGARGVSFHPPSQSGRALEVPELQLAYPEVMQALATAKELADKYAGQIKVEAEPYFYPSEKGHGSDITLPPNLAMAGTYHLGIGADGGVYPCTEVIGFEPLAIGNVREQSLLEIWNSPKWAFFRGGWDLDQLEGCKECALHGKCDRQACRCYAYAVTNDIYGPLPECFQSKEFIFAQGGTAR